MRLTKGDPTGSYSYLADGVSPASSVLTDGHTTFTPGVSEYNALGSRFYLGDAQGNSRGLLDGGQSATDGYNCDAFGSSVSRFGSNPTAYAWNEAAGYQSDGDSGLKLLGHRYYDSRTGRFISRDPAGSGDNWYAYAGNDPMDETDPSGLSPSPNPDGAWSINGGTQSDGAWATERSGMMEAQADQFMGAVRKQMAAKPKASKRYYSRHLNAPGTVWNDSSYPIPIMFDHDTKKGKVFYEMMLPPHTYTGLEDIDFVYCASDPKAPGGYDWRHILGDSNTLVVDAGPGQIVINGLFIGPTFKGYPYNVRPRPVSGNTSIDIFTIPQPGIPPELFGPIP